jgi:hypothetical protein
MDKSQEKGSGEHNILGLVTGEDSPPIWRRRVAEGLWYSPREIVAKEAVQ